MSTIWAWTDGEKMEEGRRGQCTQHHFDFFPRPCRGKGKPEAKWLCLAHWLPELWAGQSTCALFHFFSVLVSAGREEPYSPPEGAGFPELGLHVVVSFKTGSQLWSCARAASALSQ